MHENIIKKLNLAKDNGIDKEAAFKHIDSTVSDADWNKVLKSSLEFCIPKMSGRSAEFQKSVGFSQDTCNVLYTGMVLCMDISTFMVRNDLLWSICNCVTNFVTAGMSGKVLD